jgi:NRPS condensation-like uncharacterized protein
VEQSFSSKTRIELDPVGLYYAVVTSRMHPATFSISAYLSEPVVPHALQQAVNDLMHRLPFLSGRLRRGFFGYYHEILADPPMIVPTRIGHTFSAYFETGTGHVLRILYGERHFTVETLHSICDGRGLTKIVSALLVRYFEILGIATEKAGLIDWSADPRPEEAEDAFARYADLKTTDSPTRLTSTSAERPAYHCDCSQPTPTRFVTRKFDLAKVRSAAKTHDATISEYVLAHIFRAIADDRAARGSKEPITASVPIDCRSFFPSETYRNFLSDALIVMPETEDFAVMVQQLRQQFTKIDADLVHGDINASQKLRNNTRFLPRVAKKPIGKMLERSDLRRLTTTFSNLGLVKLPREVEERVEMLEFVLRGQPGSPYSFACIAVGGALTLTTTVSVEDRGITERAAEGLEA